MIEDWSVWVMKISMMIFPLICIVVGFIIYHKKFKIDEETYKNICAELEERRAGTEAPVDEGDAPVEDAPIEDAPVEDAPIEDAPASEE